MKYLFFLITSLVWLFPASSQEHHPSQLTKTATKNISTADWQADLKFLQQTVHKDYAFLFKNITPKDFDAAADKLYQSMPALQEHERQAGIARLVASFKYGHTDIGWRESPVKFHVAPVNFYWFSDGLYVEGADKKYESIIGAKLLKVENMDIEKVLTAIKPLVPAENEQYFKGYGLDHLCIPEALHAQHISKELKKTVSYTFLKDGKIFDVSIEAVDAFRFPRKYGFVSPGTDWLSVRMQTDTPLYLKNLDKHYYYQYLPGSKTVYVRHSQVLDDPQESIAAFYKNVFAFIDKNEVEKLVLDVRLNGGGNNYKIKPIVTGILENKKINQPGKLFVIIGRKTFSACQNLVNELSNYTNALFVGEPTAENINFYGDNRRVELPKTGIPVFLSFAWWQDKPQWENASWLAPHLAVEMSFDEYRTNKDPALEACLNFSDKNVVLDPMAYLKELFEAGKLNEVEAAAKKMAADSKYKYVNFEQKFNQAGYNLMNSKQMESALYVFELNTKLYPRSANVWDSFAEANWKAGKTAKAIENYNKAIELDPGGDTGTHARQQLELIKAKKTF
jgi:tetratricopeptide (TPR) repeat protein